MSGPHLHVLRTATLEVLRRGARSSSLRRAVVTALVTAFLVAPGGLSTISGTAPAAHAAPAHAAPPRNADPPVQIILTEVSPSALTPKDRLVVRGMMVNSGTRTIRDLQMRLLLRPDRITGRRALSDWTHAPATAPAGIPLTVSARTLRAPLHPGTTREFGLSAPPGTLGLSGLSSSFGPRGIAVEVTGVRDTAGRERLGLRRTLVVWCPGTAFLPTKLSLITPVVAGVRSTDAATVSPELASSMASGGRLDRVLRATTSRSVAWALDPSLLTAVHQSLEPPEREGDGSGDEDPEPTAGSTSGRGTPAPTPTQERNHVAALAAQPVPPTTVDAARSWFSLLQRERPRRELVTLPWGDPDLVALAHGDGGGLLDEADSRARTQIRRSFDQDADLSIAAPAGGSGDAVGLELVARSGRNAVLLNSHTQQAARNAVSATGGPTPTGVASLTTPQGRLTGLLFDPVLSGQLTRTGGTDAAAARQELLAELAVVTLERPYDSRHLLAVTPRAWDPQPDGVVAALEALESAPWVRPTSLAILRTTPPPDSARLTRTTLRRMVDTELPAGHVQDVTSTLARVDAFLPALAQQDDRDAIAATLHGRGLSLLGQAWRSSPPDRLDTGRSPLREAVDQLYGGVHVVEGSSVNILTATARQPVRVANDLPYPVRMTLELRPRSGVLVPMRTTTVHLGANAQRIVVVPVKAVANGDLVVEALLRSPGDDGAVLTMTPVDVRVRRTWESRGIATGSALLVVLLVVGLFRGVRRGRPRMAHRGAPDLDELAEAEAEQAARDALRAAREAQRVQLLRDQPSGERLTIALDDHAVADADTGISGPATGPLPVVLPPPRGQAVPPQSSAPPQSSVPREQSAAGQGSAGQGSAGQGSAGQGSAGQGSEDPEVAPAMTDGSGRSADPEAGGTGGVLRSSALMAAGTLLSRLLGFLRLAMLAAALGLNSASADAFAIANKVPNIIYMLLAGGVLNAVLVPQLTRAARKPDGTEYVDRLLTLALTLLGGITVVVTAAAPLVVDLYTSGKVTDDQVALSVAFAFWCLPQVFFYGLYTLWGQVLNAHGRFTAYTWSPVVNNLVALLGLALFMAVTAETRKDAGAWTPGMVALLGGTATLGVAAQAAVLYPVLRRVGFRWRPRWGFRGAGLRRASDIALWTFAAVLLAQAGFVITTRVLTGAGVESRSSAGQLDTSQAIYDGAFLLFMLPHSLVTVSLVTALFTRMSQAAAADDRDAVRADLSLGLRSTATALLPAVAAMAAIGPLITATLFWNSTRAETRGMAFGALAMMAGLIPFSAQHLLQRVFYAHEDARTPFLIQVPAVLTTTAAALLSAAVLPAQWVLTGIGLGMSASYLLSAVLSAYLLRERLGRLDGARVGRLYLRLVPAGAFAAGCAWGAVAVTRLVLDGGRLVMAFQVAVGLGALLVGYVAALRLLRVRELDDLVRPALARIRRHGP